MNIRKPFIWIALMSSVLSMPVLADAQTCHVGYIDARQSPYGLFFDVSKSNCMSEGCDVEKYVTITASGEAGIEIDSVDVREYDSASRNVFEVKNKNLSFGLDVGASEQLRVIFHARDVGKYGAELIFNYVMKSSEVDRFRECLRAEVGPEIGRLRGLIMEMEARGANFEAVDRRIRIAKERFEKASGDLKSAKSKAEQKVLDLEEEKKRVLKDMRSGYYCSKCGTSKTEFERRGENFEEHVRDVRGEKVSASQEQIDQKTREYNEKISDAQDEVDRIVKRLTSEETTLKNEMASIETFRQTVIAAFAKKLEELKGKKATLQKSYDVRLAEILQRRQQRKVLSVSVKGEYRDK